jgi:hypothetical protein
MLIITSSQSLYNQNTIAKIHLASQNSTSQNNAKKAGMIGRTMTDRGLTGKSPNLAKGSFARSGS